MRLSKFNLLLVALLGMLMRYKIGFEFKFIDQKFTQHAHSHFAFAAWITQTIMLFMIGFLEKQQLLYNHRRYKWILIGNNISAYGMLISFILGGYNTVSIVFSELSIIVFYVFAYQFYTDIRHTSKYHPSYRWFKAALFFGVLSSLGTYCLAYMMATRHVIQNLYLASVYFYLHFQYNGWFLFACYGLLIAALREYQPDFEPTKKYFYLLAVSCVPAYLLSVLWLNFPTWFLIFIFLAALSQLIAWSQLFIQFKGIIKSYADKIHPYGRFLLLVVALSYSIKLFLQLGSTIPSVSKLAFGFRPIVIAYLHLVLLGVISMFLLTYFKTFLKPYSSKWNWAALLLFAGGVYFNEIALTVQGVASFSYTVVPYMNEILFGLAVAMFAGTVLMNMEGGGRGYRG